MEQKQLIIGLGTGRCGTVSLSKLLVHQGADVTHEVKILPWVTNEKRIDTLLSSILNRDNKIVSDVAFYYLPYVPYIIEKYPNTKFVCFKRDKQQTVDSYVLKFNDRNHLSLKHNFRAVKHWDDAYPKYDTDRRTATGLYWNDYYKMAESYKSKYSNFKIFNMIDALNNKKLQFEMLKFCGFETPKIKLKVKLNSGPKH